MRRSTKASINNKNECRITLHQNGGTKTMTAVKGSSDEADKVHGLNMTFANCSPEIGSEKCDRRTLA